ncbi:MAG TPA: HAD family hydrolase [Candidatus Borkfalkia stercoripullorum]|nr:HAD family hydrolase [Candidatus Borkfalkia stercoripullorum]
MLKAVLFDLDGTVLDTLPDLNACMNEALGNFGCPPITLEQTRRYVGNGGLMFAARALPESRKGDAEYFYKNVYCPVHFACKNGRTKPFAGEAECMAALERAGIKRAVVTNKSQRAADELGETLLKPYGFSAVFGNRDGVPVKPDPTLALMALEALGAAPSEAAFVGDGETDVQTAKNAGMRSVSVLWGYRPKEVLVSAGAERFARTFSELAQILLSM